ncbi:N-6 DNA methylase [Methylobacterium sp. W2]|uniref:HsdM family class I SAM-dependent methyltransferase n=1 Tax=Methylobacterium sp. W2 TaxID=2598107 RepID=UPI001D0C1E8E|nr:N-6 DNA methylase [Methylobacterium sp. W2]MCC0807652.1 N-6 DNA methylase [Methylobacterium sp. W2]
MTQSISITLDMAHEMLGWPEPKQVTHPQGSGASVYASLVHDKIGRSLGSSPDFRNARLGVLMADPDAATSEPPLAIVVEFDQSPSADALRELQRLSWNFSHSPTLITIEPTTLRVWSCCEAPNPDRPIADYLVTALTTLEMAGDQSTDLQRRAARALHWVNLVSGHFFAMHEGRFDRDGRADQMLLGNMRYIRDELAARGLVDDDVCHDLLARVIFVQFLFDRKDQDGNPALTEAKLHRLHKDQVLEERHSSFSSVLANYEDTYRLFDWLNTKFNGDLFPGKGDTAEARAIGWNKERSIVSPAHLGLLAEFIRGDLDMQSRQACLWPQYAFDVIPLEFISSIYETFVTERASQDGIFYTPPHMVDFVLDRVLPWHGTEWDLRILDPSCGSGIFLVKAFQRLVHRWKAANPDQPVRAEVLRRLLERNIFGVDIDPHAVRVACFSLYLAMCDEIEPRHYWTQVSFPSMRDVRLIRSDFFNETHKGFSCASDANSYDLIIGNAPWGDGVITDRAREWALDERRKWPVTNNDIGGLFVVKAAELAKGDGRVALIQSANSLLFNISPTAIEFRQKLLLSHRVETIYNLSALRFSVFKRKTHTTKTSAAPVCVIVLTKAAPAAEDVIDYISPRYLKPFVDEFTVVIEPNDRRALTVAEAVSDQLIWTQLMWGSKRDITLLKRLRAYPSLASRADMLSQQGIKFGDRTKIVPALSEWRIFNDTSFPDGVSHYLDVADFPKMGNAPIHSRASTSVAPFAAPQLIVKQSWTKPSGRFNARLTRSAHGEGLLCNESYYSIHCDSEAVLNSACLVFNSKVAVYILLLTSGRFLYRPKPSKGELLGLPVPHSEAEWTYSLDAPDTIDRLSFELFQLNEPERILVEDMIDYTLGDFIGNEQSVGRQSTLLVGADPEAHLRSYCEIFARVLKAGFGEQKSIAASIFHVEEEHIPYRLVAFELGGASIDSIGVKKVDSDELLGEFRRLDTSIRSQGGIFNQRVVRIYDVEDGVPTVFIVKPDQKRFWTRSTALQDGDEVALDLFRLAQTTEEAPEGSLH